MTARKVSRRWPVQPLAELVGGRGELGRIVDSGNLTRAWRDGLTDRSADAWAVRCGYHPSEVWPSMMDAAIEDASKPCAHCGTPFVPSNRRQMYHQPACRTSAHRARSPKAQAASRAAAAAYYAQHGDYARARQRRYYAANADAERKRSARNRELRRSNNAPA